MGGSAPGDGRLELDELGSVLDHASSLDPASWPEDLLEGSDATTWAERLETAGLTPWLRRHRVALATGSALAVLVAVLGIAHLRSLPPPLDPTISVEVDEGSAADPGSAGLQGNEAGVVAATYEVRSTRPGSTVRILGVTGPGLRDSSVIPVSRSADGSVDTATVVALLGCDDPRALDPGAGDYEVRVAQTDAWDRTSVGLAPVPLTVVGSWGDQVQGTCLQQSVTESVLPTSVRVEPAGPDRAIRVVVGVHNGLDQAVTLQAGQGQGTTVYSAPDVAQVDAGADGRVVVSMRVDNCAERRLDPAFDPGGIDSPGGAQVGGVDLFATLDRSEGQRGGTVLVPWTASVERLLRQRLDRACAGMPAATASVVSASRSPADPTVEFGAQADPTVVALRMVVRVDTAADSVTVRDGTPEEDLTTGSPLSITSATADVIGGHATATVDWLVTCSSGVTAPPLVGITVTKDGRSWPVLQQLPSAALELVYRAVCPDLNADDLVPNGWPASA